MYENRKIAERYHQQFYKALLACLTYAFANSMFKLGVYSQIDPIVSCPKQAQTMTLHIMSTIFRSQNISMKTVGMTISALM